MNPQCEVLTYHLFPVQGSLRKSKHLCHQFRQCFFIMSSSHHIINQVDNECAGNASNASAAADCLTELCIQHKLEADYVLVTVMDADTLISSRYVCQHCQHIDNGNARTLNPRAD